MYDAYTEHIQKEIDEKEKREKSFEETLSLITKDFNAQLNKDQMRFKI